MAAFFLGIDPAKDNLGVVLCKGDRETLEPLAALRIAYESDKKFISKIINLVYLHQIELHKLYVNIEKQPYQSSISSNMRYVQGYLTALGATVVVKLPITHGLKISSYKERKQYSVQQAVERLNSNEIKNQDGLMVSLMSDKRKHDIADGFNLAYNLWIEVRRSI